MFYLNFAENAPSRLTITDWLDLGSNVSGDVKSFQDSGSGRKRTAISDDDNSLDQQRSAEQLTERVGRINSAATERSLARALMVTNETRAGGGGEGSGLGM